MQRSVIIRLVILTVMVSCTMTAALKFVNQGNLNEAKDV